MAYTDTADFAAAIRYGHSTIIYRRLFLWDQHWRIDRIGASRLVEIERFRPSPWLGWPGSTNDDRHSCSNEQRKCVYMDLSIFIIVLGVVGSGILILL